jgi:flavin-dependent dehydrogenase
MCEEHAGARFKAFAERVSARWGLGLPGCPAAFGPPRQKVLPLAPIRRTYGDRVLAVGDAAGLVKATTGGGIYYSLVSGAAAATVLAEALGADTLTAKTFKRYETIWRKRLGSELRAQLTLRLLAHRLGDRDIEAFFELARTNGVMPIVHRTARFNRHRDLIVSLLRHQPARRLLFKQLVARTTAIAVQ